MTEEAWTDWIDGERQRLEGLALDAMVKFGDLELQSGMPDRALAPPTGRTRSATCARTPIAWRSRHWQPQAAGPTR